MTLSIFVIIIVMLLAVFQALQIYFFYRRQIIVGSIFILCFWTVFGFMVHSAGILFSSNYTGGQIRPRSIVIKRGSSLSQISNQLSENGIIKSRDDFLWTAKLLGLAKNMRAGKFVVIPTMSNYALTKLLTSSASAVQERVTVIEGLTAKNIASLFKNKLDIDSTRFVNIVFDSTYAEKFELPSDNLEGYLLPETYYFTYGVDEEEIIETLISQFKSNLTETLLSDIDKLEMTLSEIITLASIIEGEAIIDDERPMISSVYHNRLTKGWRLQADPTIQYIIPDSPRRLLNADLQIDSPYNTYKNKGLPPGPINNPGISSIRAAVYPASESYLYFVATGDGKHTFSRTQAEHLEAKKKLDRLRRQYRRR